MAASYKPVSDAIIKQHVAEYYTNHKADLKGTPLAGKIQVIADKVFYELYQDPKDPNVLNKDNKYSSVGGDYTDDYTKVEDIVKGKVIDEIAREVCERAEKNPQIINELKSHDRIGYLFSLILQTNPDLDIENPVDAFFVYETALQSARNLSVNRFVNRIKYMKEKELNHAFPFLLNLQPMTLEEKKAYLARQYMEYQKDFAQYDLSLLPETANDFQKVTDWNSCNEIFELNSRPLSDRARTFIAFGHLVVAVKRATDHVEGNPAIAHFIYNEHPEIQNLSPERLALWESLASISVEIILKQSLQKITLAPPSIHQEFERRSSLPKQEVQLSGKGAPVRTTEQFAKDLERIGESTLIVHRADGEVVTLFEAPPEEIYSNLEAVMPENQEGFFVIQELCAQTIQNIGMDWLTKDLDTQTGLTIGASASLITMIPNLTKREILSVDKDTVRITFTYDLSALNFRRQENMQLIDLELPPQLSGTYQFIYSCEARRNGEGKWIAQDLQQHPEIPALGESNESSAIPLSVPSELIAEQSDDKAAGKEEAKPAVYELKEAIPVISNTLPESAKTQESEKKPLSFNGNKKNFSDTKLDMGQLMARYYKEPSPNSSAQSSSSQPTKEPQSSNAVEPTLKDYWYNKHWVNYEKVPETFSDSKKLNSIIEKLNILQGRTEIEGRPDLKIRDRDLLLFTQYACYRLEILKDKLKKGTLLSQSEKNEFRMMADFTKNRKKQLLKVVKSGSNLNGSQATELDLLIEKRKEVIAPSVKIKANPSPVDFHTKYKDEKNESDVIDPALAEAITNAKKNETINPGIIKEKEKTEQKVRFENTARRIDIDVKKESPIITESAPDLKPSHELTKKRRQNSSASNRGFGFY